MNLIWLKGRYCSRIHEHYPGNTTFTFGDAQLAVDGWWRVIVGGLVSITSQDHQQLFGRSKPIDARREAMAVLAERPIEQAILREAGDVVITVEGGTRLEVLVSSAGCESWNLTAPGHHFVGMPGGRVSDFSPEA